MGNAELEETDETPEISLNDLRAMKSQIGKEWYQLTQFKEKIMEASEQSERIELSYIREDIRDLKQDNKDIKKSIEDLKKEVKDDINTLKTDLTGLINRGNNDLNNLRSSITSSLTLGVAIISVVIVLCTVFGISKVNTLSPPVESSKH